MCSCDADAPLVYRENTVVARKEHKCVECKETIPKGAAYRICSGLWGGTWRNYKQCSGCVRAHSIAYRLLDCFCPMFGDLWWEIREQGALEDVAFELEQP